MPIVCLSLCYCLVTLCLLWLGLNSLCANVLVPGMALLPVMQTFCRQG